MVRRIFVEKKEGYNVAARKLAGDLRDVLGFAAEDVRIFIRYDVEGLDEEAYRRAVETVFAEAPVDDVRDTLPELSGYAVFAVEYLPGQYDQRADSAMQCVQLLTMRARPLIKCATVYAIKGADAEQTERIKKYLINPVESREGAMTLPETLRETAEQAGAVPVLDGFNAMDAQALAAFHAAQGFAMSAEDMAFVQEYFRGERRDPTETEIKVIDTYWSDHCRHTTFATELTDIRVESGNPHIAAALDKYRALFKEINGARADKYPCLMDIATIAVKKLRKEGKLDNLDVSDEINACSVEADVDNDGRTEKWLIMFKNETHNHPTEIEPFGGAATCLGGAIRDPLSGRCYVYQAMRVTGSADPRTPFDKTMKGKLPQRVISTTAAAGYSSYGNQIGLATGQVAEMYHENYVAKRLETGYVIAGAPKANVVRRRPAAGDVVLLLGGETGRDGCGGATGSSKAHTEKSVEVCGAEVQKGNPPTERKLQRLFRNPEASRLIVKCNDFGAGGVSVAIGELSDSLDIDLDRVPKKYEGLSGTELAISESQERMAVVLAAKDEQKFIALAAAENLGAVRVAEVTDNGRMRMFLGGACIVDLEREFLDTNGVKQKRAAAIAEPASHYMDRPDARTAALLAEKKYAEAVLHELGRLNVCSQKGLGERFDSTIGAASVLMPFGGKYQLTPACAMAAKPPVSGHTDTATLSSYGCSPQLMSDSPFIGAIHSIVLSLSKLVACGADPDTVRLSLQEFFKRLNKDEYRWGEPLSALLGALDAQLGLGVGAIGGKDSMSGSFEQIDVPPTLISFAMGIAKASKVISNVFDEKAAKRIWHLPIKRDAWGYPDFKYCRTLYGRVYAAIAAGKIKACTVAEEGGVAAAVFKACMGNKAGTTWSELPEALFRPNFGDLIALCDEEDAFDGLEAREVARLNGTYTADLAGVKLKMNDAAAAFTAPLEGVYPTVAPAAGEVGNVTCCGIKTARKGPVIARPRVLIPVFPGTNCEYDTARAFERAGGRAEVFIVKNRSAADIEETAKALVDALGRAQILAFPGGFSGGDEPDGSGKFIATTFRNPAIAEAVMKLLYERDGLALGICNGFQALIKLGLVPYGDIRPQSAGAPTLTFNNISRHVSAIVNVRVATNKSPWLQGCRVDEIYAVPVSHGEGRFVASEEELKRILAGGQIATQYVDFGGNATMQSPFNPNGSMYAVEGIISKDGRVLGKMGHAERLDKDLYKNVEGNFDMKLFESGVGYFE